MNLSHLNNVDQEEILKFEKLASQWWDRTGPCQALHAINPLRLQFISERVKLQNNNVLDIGCGGGILSEALAQEGAQVTGIDASTEVIGVAKLHSKASGLALDYHALTVEEYGQKFPEKFDLITCMELLEHVPNPCATINACCKLLKPGGDIFFSTLNRTLKSYLFAIIGAEYLLKLIPPGTHEYAKFIRPSELDKWVRKSALNLTLKDIVGIAYNPFTGSYSLSKDIQVNYLVHYSDANE